MIPRTRLPSDTARGVPPPAPMRFAISSIARRDLTAEGADMPRNRVDGALSDLAAVDVAAAHPRLRGELDEAGAEFVDVATAEPVLFLHENDDRTAFGRLVGEARELRGIGELLDANAVGRE